MKIGEIKDKVIWEEFALRFSPSNFLTSWEWAEFNNAMGDLSYRLGKCFIRNSNIRPQG